MEDIGSIVEHVRASRPVVLQQFQCFDNRAEIIGRKPGVRQGSSLAAAHGNQMPIRSGDRQLVVPRNRGSRFRIGRVLCFRVG